MPATAAQPIKLPLGTSFVPYLVEHFCSQNKRATVRSNYLVTWSVFVETVFSDLAVSISEIRKNPAETLGKVGARPVAVLSHNKPVFYMVEPKLFELMLEQLADVKLAELVAARTKLKDKAIEIDIHSI